MPTRFIIVCVMRMVITIWVTGVRGIWCRNLEMGEQTCIMIGIQEWHPTLCKGSSAGRFLTTSFTWSDYHVFSKIKIWLTIQCFETHKELMDGVNNWPNIQGWYSVTKDCKSCCHSMASAWIWVAAVLKNIAVMYVSFICNKIFSLYLIFSFLFNQPNGGWFRIICHIQLKGLLMFIF